jgi:hypothetical protein
MCLGRGHSSRLSNLGAALEAKVKHHRGILPAHRLLHGVSTGVASIVADFQFIEDSFQNLQGLRFRTH